MGLDYSLEVLEEVGGYRLVSLASDFENRWYGIQKKSPGRQWEDLVVHKGDLQKTWREFTILVESGDEGLAEYLAGQAKMKGYIWG